MNLGSKMCVDTAANSGLIFRNTQEFHGSFA